MSIHKLIFTELSREQKELATLLQKEFGALNERIAWQFIDDPSEIKYHGEGSALVISPSLSYTLEKILFQSANPFYLSWESFLPRMQKILTAPAPLSLRKAALAFLGNPLGKLIARIFDLYGYQCIMIDTLAELDRIEAEKIDYLVLNLDIPQELIGNRNVVLKDLKGVCLRNPGMSVNVIKNFDQGSLYDDIKSPVKDFCNLLLSPEEYVSFIKKFFYHCELERLFYINRANAPSPVGKENRAGRPLKNNFIHLQNPKKIFNETVEKPDYALWRYGIEEVAMIEFRREALLWLEGYFARQTQEIPRGSFSFIPEGIEAASFIKNLADVNSAFSPKDEYAYPAP